MGFLSNLKESMQKKQEEIEAKKAADAAALNQLKQVTFKLRNNDDIMPDPMPSDGRIILEKDEKVYLITPGLTYLEDRTSRVNFGGAGASFHVAKGVTFRTGGGTAIPVHQLQIVDNGSLYVTNKKVVFIGAKKNVVFPLKKIVACSYFANGIHIASSTRKTPIIVHSRRNYPEVWDYADTVIKALVTNCN